MLGLLKAFEKKVDHPMATARDASAILETLSNVAPMKLLEDIEQWLRSVAETDGFACDDRLAVIRLMDDASRTPAGAVFADFLAHAKERTASRRATFELLHRYWSSLADAYSRCISDFDQGERNAARIREEMPLVLVRAFRGSSCVARLLHLHYQEVPMEFWVRLALQLAIAERRGFDQPPVVPYPKEIHSTARGELLKILGLYLAAPHELSIEHIELAYRIIDRFAASFSWSREPAEECNFAINIAIDVRPRRCDPKDRATDTSRFFGGGPALKKLEEIEQICNANIVSDEIRFGAGFTPEHIVSVIRHIRLYLGRNPPQRRFPRLALSAPISVIHGFRPICQRVSPLEGSAVISGQQEPGNDAARDAAMRLQAEEVESEPETWQATDRSDWGVGTEVPRGLGQWAEPGVLCGIQERVGGPWLVGVIRRLDVAEGGGTRCGFWIMSKKPLSVWLRLLGSEAHKADNWASSTGSFSYTYLRAIVLPDAIKSHEKPPMILEPKAFVPGDLCEMMIGEHSRMIQMRDLLEAGSDYVRVTFDWCQPGKLH